MSVIELEGFEAGSLDIFDLGHNFASIVTNPTAGSWSTRALSTGDFASKRFPGANASDVWVGLRFQIDGYGNRPLFLLRSPNAVTQAYIDITAGGFLEAFRGDGTKLGEGTRFIALNRWYWLDWHLLVSDTAGVFEIWVDEVQDVNLTGVDTRNDAGSALVDRIYFQSPAGGSLSLRVDDYVVHSTAGTRNNGRVGDLGVAGLLVTGAGTVTQLSRGGTDSGANWSQVDEVPPNDATDYVYGSTLNTYDLYQLQDSLAELTDIKAVNVSMRAQKIQPGSAAIAPVLKYDSNGDGVADTEATGADRPLSMSWAWEHWLYETQPDGTDWTRAKLDALQVGPKVR